MHHDPALDAFVEETRNMNDLVAAFMPTVPSFSTTEGIAALRADGGLFASAPVDSVIERTLSTPGREIPARCIVPATVDAVYLDIHGGGWCIGDAKSGDAVNAALAEAANVAVISIDYRLAPEHPYPAGPEDCEAAALWLIEHAEEQWGVTRLLIGGASAGAHLSALSLLRLRDRHGQGAVDRFVGANLLFGAYDLGMTPSQRAGENALVIPLATMEACYAHFLPGFDREKRRAAEYSPLYASLVGLPPALFTVGTADPLLDDSLFMATRWEAAGNESTLAVYPESVHGFPSFPTEMARHAQTQIHRWLRSKAATP